jgi:hypothetical protein
MRYREFIHKFLQRSLMVYLHYDQEIAKIKQNYEVEKLVNLESIKEESSDIDSERLPDNLKRVNDKISKKSSGKLQRNESKKNSVPSNYSIDPDFEVNKHMDKIKEELYIKFASKIEKIIKYFEDKNMQQNDIRLEKPLNILKKLKDIKEVNDRNELIEELEQSVSNLLS